jgi:hypothetical protein
MVEPLSSSWILDRVDRVLGMAAMKPLPQVWIGEPEYENGELVNPTVDGLRLMQHLPGGFTGTEANEAAMAGFVDELLFCLAAKRGLVLVDRTVATDESLTPKVLADELPPEDLAFLLLKVRGNFPMFGTFNTEQDVCLRLAAEEELTPEDLVIDHWYQEEEADYGIFNFDRLVPRDELMSEQAIRLNRFIYLAENVGEERYFIEATDRVRFAVETIQAIESL